MFEFLSVEISMKLLKILAAIILLGGCVALAVYSYTKSEGVIRRMTIQVLRAISRVFLVLETEEQISVATVDGGG